MNMISEWFKRTFSDAQVVLLIAVLLITLLLVTLFGSICENPAV